MQRVGEQVLPGSERVVSSVNDLEEGFDPSTPLTIRLEYEVLPTVRWKTPYREATVTIR